MNPAATDQAYWSYVQGSPRVDPIAANQAFWSPGRVLPKIRVEMTGVDQGFPPPTKSSAKPVARKPMSFIKSTLQGARNLMQFGSWSDLTKGPKPPPRRRPLSPRPRERTQILGGSNVKGRSFSPSRYFQRLFQAPKIVVNADAARMNLGQQRQHAMPISERQEKWPLQRPRIVINQNQGDTS